MPGLALSLSNDQAALETARLAVVDFVAGHGLSARAVYRLELVLEETLMNLISHAFPAGGKHAIELTLHLEPEALTLCFEDDGVAFDPLHVLHPDKPRSLAEARPGGLGLMLTRKTAISSRYERVEGRNRLTLELART